MKSDGPFTATLYIASNDPSDPVQEIILKGTGFGGPEFTELLSVHAKELCVDGTPHCPACPLKADCPTAPEVLAAAKAKPADGKAKPKSR